jgi:hypothetical protein
MIALNYLILFSRRKFMNSTMSFVQTMPLKQLVKQTECFNVGNFDKSRMKKALFSETVELPEGLTREEMRQFILEQTQK